MRPQASGPDLGSFCGRRRQQQFVFAVLHPEAVRLFVESAAARSRDASSGSLGIPTTVIDAGMVETFEGGGLGSAGGRAHLGVAGSGGAMPMVQPEVVGVVQDLSREIIGQRFFGPGEGQPGQFAAPAQLGALFSQIPVISPNWLIEFEGFLALCRGLLVPRLHEIPLAFELLPLGILDL